jgi:hypothetical protein
VVRDIDDRVTEPDDPRRGAGRSAPIPVSGMETRSPRRRAPSRVNTPPGNSTPARTVVRSSGSGRNSKYSSTVAPVEYMHGQPTAGAKSSQRTPATKTVRSYNRPQPVTAVPRTRAPQAQPGRVKAYRAPQRQPSAPSAGRSRPQAPPARAASRSAPKPARQQRPQAPRPVAKPQTNSSRNDAAPGKSGSGKRSRGKGRDN